MAVNRRLTFYAWADINENHPFDRAGGATTLAGLEADEIVLDQGEDTLTAVDMLEVGHDGAPTRLLLHALHGPGSRPSQYGPGEGTQVINIGEGRYTAFTSHVVIWQDKIAAIDMHANAPGLGRLSTYFWKQAQERVAFRPLYKQDVAERLQDLEGIRGVDFSIHEPHKITETRKRGMLGSLLPRRKFPSIHVSAGMSRRDPHNAYLDDEIAQEIFEIADDAEQFFDRITIRGRSKTEKTPAGRPKTIEINLLSERLQIERQLDTDAANPSLPDQEKVFAALDGARRTLTRDGRLQDAVEARLAYDAARGG